ncbi:MAG: GIY-YIG nuclease family protein [Candidatus Thiodiazotropha sp. (ex Codakia orbicularis)]|nr:GIY-YIG nuclease family protein [Candidatus Thiodiazotropha sp. (ex Codakia orbicularis)]
MYTYFIIENEDNDEHRIKIGCSKKPEQRIRNLQTGNSRKLCLMGWIECSDQSIERLLHEKYEEFRLNGEWFSIEPCNVLEELKTYSTTSYICIQANAGAFLGCDTDAIPEYLGPWEWLDTEIQEFCPQCGWGGGVHYNNSLGSESCLRCGYPIF